ncbi:MULTISPECIES: hypothetical protein [unclassified Marinitoga]|uniref:hypothetical protein n=1 Tax=unclassified Marinitoga TaxID=2640159 RepID=UPI0009506DA0|nr:MULTISPECIES: hypothetical protein [unclassified Marinitoga]APT76467.1 hypothetical protein LN42_08820 [Marinitoga sp. 1137]NUU98151.1 hypothetical protein [Marinitoga sp. 1138]
MKSKIWLILKYSYQNKVRPRKNKKGIIKRRGPWSALLAYLFPPILFGGMLAPIFYMMFKSLNFPLSELGIETTWNLLDLIFGGWFLTMGFMFVLNYAPAIVANLFESEITQLLLVMPVRRFEIYVASAVDSFIMAGIPIGMMIPVFVIYAILRETNIFFTILSGIGYILLLLFIANLFGSILSRYLTKTSAKRWTMIMYFINIFLYVGGVNMMPSIGVGRDMNYFVDVIKKILNIILNDFWPHTWFLKAMNGDLISMAILYGATFILGYFIYKISDKIEFSSSNKSKKKKKSVEINFKHSKFPMFKKDFKLLFRDSQTFFLILYPIFLPLIMIFTSDSLEMIGTIFIMLSGMYAAMIAIYALSYEGKIWPNPKLYPLKSQELVFSKVAIPVIIFVLEYIALAIIIITMEKSSTIIFYSVFPITLILIYSSILGIKLYLSNPKRDLSQKNILNGKEVFMLEGITLGLTMGIFVLGNLYIASLKNPSMKDKFIDWLFDSPFLYHFIGAGIPIFLLCLTIYLIVKETKKIHKLLISWE